MVYARPANELLYSTHPTHIPARYEVPIGHHRITVSLFTPYTFRYTASPRIPTDAINVGTWVPTRAFPLKMGAQLTYSASKSVRNIKA